MWKALAISFFISFCGLAVFADQADQVFAALAAKNAKEATRLCQNLALTGNFPQLDKIQASKPELLGETTFPGEFLDRIIFNFVETASIAVRSAWVASGETNPNGKETWQWYLWELDRAVKNRAATKDPAVKKTLQSKIDMLGSKIENYANSRNLTTIRLFKYSIGIESVSAEWNDEVAVAAEEILDYLFKAGVPFPARFPSSLALHDWERLLSAYVAFGSITAPEKQSEYETKAEFAARNAEWRRIGDLIMTTELALPASLALGSYNVEAGYFPLAISLPALTPQDRQRDDGRSPIVHGPLVEMRDLDKADIRYYLDRKNAPFFKDKGFAAWTATATIAAQRPGIYRLRELQVRAGKEPVATGLWAFSLRPTLGAGKENIVVIDNFIKGNEYDFSGTKVSGQGASIPFSAEGSYTLTSAAGGPGTLWSAGLAPSDFNNTRYEWQAHSTGEGNQYIAIASSGDGSHLAVVPYAGRICTSRDSGVAWAVQTGPDYGHWNSIASSSDGSHLAAAGGNNGGIWLSTDFGAGWTRKTIDGVAVAAASSADGTRLAIATEHGDVWTSMDAGLSWSQRLTGESDQSISIASSADGMHLALAGSYCGILISEDSGATWLHQEQPGRYALIASSADGTRIAAAGEGGILVSADSGRAWSRPNADMGRGVSALALSGDGSHLAVAPGDGDVWTSTNLGASWQIQGLRFSDGRSPHLCALASSADGTRLACVGTGQEIWISGEAY
jgi:hypothetical protein